MKYKVGDKVKVHSLDWFKKNKVFDDLGWYYSLYSGEDTELLVPEMSDLCDTVVTITEEGYDFYCVKGDDQKYEWQDWMFEGLA
jgi:hypothetical protein